jgi:CheY-like chemotaxis protein
VTQVVVCEDEPSIQKLVEFTLGALAYDVRVANDGVEGLELVEQLRPDLIITDIYMPRLDGLEMVDAIRQRPALEAIPVLFMTAGVQRWQLERAARVPETELLHKPFSPAELRARVQKLINSGSGSADAETAWRKY